MAETGTGYWAALQPGLRVYAVDARGVGFDTAVQPTVIERIVPRATARWTFVAAGALVLRGEQESLVEAGRAVFETGRPPWSERWEGHRRRRAVAGSPEFRAVVVEWEEPLAADGAPVVVPVPGPLRRRAGDAAQGLADPTLDPAARYAALAPLVAHLCAELGRPTPVRETVPDAALPILQALTAAQQNLTLRPALVDVEALVGRPIRDLRREAARWPAWFGPYGWPSAWRTRLRAIRLVTATRLFSARNATVEAVATATGYGSARALLLALDQEGYPPPSVLRRILAGTLSAPDS